MLKSEQNTKQVELEILKAAKTKFVTYHIEDDIIHAVFDHGQWWVKFFDLDEDMERTFSVVDAEGYGSINGLDFEEV